MSQIKKTVNISKPLPFGYVLKLPILFDILRGDVVDLSVIYSDTTIPDGLLTYEVSRPSVAKIDNNGLFVAINSGVTDIKIIHPEFTIHTWCAVRPSVQVDEDLYITPDNPTVNIGDTIFLKLRSESVTINNSDVQWFSPDNGTVISLSKNGYLVALRDGVFSVRAKYVGRSVELFGRVEGEIMIPEDWATPARINEAICGRSVCDIVDVISEDVDAVYTYSVRLANYITDFRLLTGQVFTVPYVIERSDKYGNKIELSDIVSTNIEVVEDPYNILDVKDFRTIQIAETGGATFRLNYKGVLSDIVTIRSEYPKVNIIRGQKDEYDIGVDHSITVSISNSSGEAVYLYEDDIIMTSPDNNVDIFKRNQNTFELTPKDYKDINIDVTYREIANNQISIYTPIDYYIDFELLKDKFYVEVGKDFKISYRIRKIFNDGTIEILPDEENAILVNTYEDPAVMVDGSDSVSPIDPGVVELHLEYNDRFVNAKSPAIKVTIVEEFDEEYIPDSEDVWNMVIENTEFLIKVGDTVKVEYEVSKNGIIVENDTVAFDYIYNRETFTRDGDIFTAIKSGEWTIQYSTPYMDGAIIKVGVEDTVITFTERNFTMYIGETKEMFVVDNFENTLEGFSLSSSDRYVVSTEDMSITALRVGEIILTATNAEQEQSTSTLVTVEPAPVINFYEPPEKIYVGDTIELDLRDRYNQPVLEYTIESSHPDIIFAEDRKITGVIGGSAIIKATFMDVETEIIVLSVIPEIMFETDEIAIDMNVLTGLVVFNESGEEIEEFTLTSSDPDIVYTYGKTIEGITEGDAIITATVGDLSCDMIVTVRGTEITDVNFPFAGHLNNVSGNNKLTLDSTSTNNNVVFDGTDGLMVDKGQRFDFDNAFLIPFDRNFDLIIDCQLSMDRTRAHILGSWNDRDQLSGPRKLSWIALRNQSGPRHALEIQDIAARAVDGSEKVERLDIELAGLTDEIWSSRNVWKLSKRGDTMSVYINDILFGEKECIQGITECNKDNVGVKFDRFNDITINSISAKPGSTSYEFEGTINNLQLYTLS
ncbi:MAG: hypothetical protein ACRCZ9_12050 [Fusobacteriaceae bacterium]